MKENVSKKDSDGSRHCWNVLNVESISWRHATVIPTFPGKKMRCWDANSKYDYTSLMFYFWPDSNILFYLFLFLPDHYRPANSHMIFLQFVGLHLNALTFRFLQVTVLGWFFWHSRGWELVRGLDCESCQFNLGGFWGIWWVARNMEMISTSI